MAQSKNVSLPITMPFSPTRQEPESSWAHYEVWNIVRGLLAALPNHFSTELLIRGINATEIFAIGSALSAIVETQVVGILNRLRPIWDAQNRYADYAFVRQSQTFPDVLLQHRTNERDIIFGIELKSWYVLSKEGEPSFRYQVTPKACAEADLLLVIPWILSDVISGTPKVLQPYTELALYAAEYRNFYWQRSRLERGEIAGITSPPEANCYPYPSSKQEASDEAAGDKGGNFGRIARAGLLDAYIQTLVVQDYLGIKLTHWITFFKAIAESRRDSEIERKLQTLRAQMQREGSTVTEKNRVFWEILDRLEKLIKEEL
jgi:hypothetical protein